MQPQSASFFLQWSYVLALDGGIVAPTPIASGFGSAGQSDTGARIVRMALIVSRQRRSTLR
jgi:hypothetical protein